MGPNNMSRVMNYIEIFLPTFDCFDRAESTWAIWFEEIMKLWTDCQSPSWSKVNIRGFEKWGEGCNFWNNSNKCVTNKPGIKVCISCS